MLSDKQGRKLTKYVPDYVVFDLETTGVSDKCDRVIEISAVKVRGGVVTDEFTSLVNPGMHIPYSATEVNGITDSMVKDSPSFEVVLKEFVDFIEDLPLVGHNIIYFDMRFIYRDLMDYYGKTIDNDYIDTVQMSRICIPEISHSLTNMAEHYGISSEGAHRALNDCRMNQLVYENLGIDIANPPSGYEIHVCPECGNLLKKREGKFGPFFGCTNYPECKFTRKCRN